MEGKKLMWCLKVLVLILYYLIGSCGKAKGEILLSQSRKKGPPLAYPNSIFEWKSEIGTSNARIIPDHHYVSTFLNEGISKRFLYMNENESTGNVLSVLVTPCTSVLLWSVKFWSSPSYTNATTTTTTVIRDFHLTKEPELLKSFRTERSATFYDLKSRPGVYIIEIKALHSDSYVHLYAASGPEPVRIPSNFIETSDINPGVPKPKISIRRLRGNRLHVKWEASSHNPHLIKYCIVVNSYRDYSSLCAAQGVKYGVLPPDLMHVSYYYYPFDKPAIRRRLPSYYRPTPTQNSEEELYAADHHDNVRQQKQQNLVMNDDDAQRSTVNHNHHHPDDSIPDQHHQQQQYQRRHRHRHYFQNQSDSSSFEERERARDLIIGCVNQKTNYILNNLREGKLYYFNVFVKDSSTNFTYPYLRTTIKYQVPKNLANGIKDAKAIKLSIGRDSVDDDGGSGGGQGDGGKKSTLVKFNVKKPCSLRMYVMPCGGTISYQLIHAYKSIIESQPVDSLSTLKIAMPEKGRYYIRLTSSQTHLNNNNNKSSLPRMVELYVSKRNKRFPLPKLPHNTQIIEELSERSCDSVKILWHPSPDPKDNEYCIFFKEETRKRIFNFKKPNQCDVERSLNSDPWVTQSMCIQRSPPKTPGQYLSQTVGGLHPDKIYIVQLILRRHKGKALSYDLMQVATLSQCTDLHN